MRPVCQSLQWMMSGLKPILEHGQDGAAEIGEAFIVIAVAVEAIALEIPFCCS